MGRNFMRQQAMGSKMLYGRPIPVARIVQGISDRKLFHPIYGVTELISRCTEQHSDVR
jgi:hypothetical protein